jgi:protein tyrosine/serine phosphatase
MSCKCPETAKPPERNIAPGGFELVASMTKIAAIVKAPFARTALLPRQTRWRIAKTSLKFAIRPPFCLKTAGRGRTAIRGHSMNMKRVLTRSGLALLGLCAALGVYLLCLQWSGNFHEVLPGRYYRSAQLSATTLATDIEKYHIKTIINLRGAKPGTRWYDDELAVAEAYGVTHVDFPMSASKRLTPEESYALVAALRAAQGPLLVHCKSGADRTGLASVMYLQQVAGVDEETAEWQLTPVYGHVNIPFTGVYAMDDTWEAFEKLIGLPS